MEFNICFTITSVIVCSQENDEIWFTKTQDDMLLDIVVRRRKNPNAFYDVNDICSPWRAYFTFTFVVTVRRLTKSYDKFQSAISMGKEERLC